MRTTNQQIALDKINDRAKKERLIVFEFLKKAIPKDEDGFISTQELANFMYPKGPFFPAPFTSGKEYKQNVYGDVIAGQLKYLEKEGLVESKLFKRRRLWKIV